MVAPLVFLAVAMAGTANVAAVLRAVVRTKLLRDSSFMRLSVIVNLRVGCDKVVISRGFVFHRLQANADSIPTLEGSMNRTVTYAFGGLEHWVRGGNRY